MERECWQETDEALIERLRRVESRSRELYSESLELLAEIEGRGLAQSLGYGGVVALLRDVLRLSLTESRRRVGHMQAVQHSPALADPALSAEHLAAITTTLDALPAADAEAAEPILVQAARELDPLAVRRLGREIIARVDQDGLEPADADVAGPVNQLDLTVKRDGRVALRGELDAEAGTLLTALISPLAKPRPDDVRSIVERQGDALAELVHLAANAAVAPMEGGERPHLTVTVSLETLRAGESTSRRMACDAQIIPMVLGSKSEPLDIGRATRTIPTAIRRALVQRDTGCAYPGCDRRAGWCDGHHVQSWVDGGPTSLDNLVLLCRSHHRLIHNTPWQVRIRDGIPEFIPPKIVDQDQAPRINPIWRQSMTRVRPSHVPASSGGSRSASPTG